MSFGEISPERREREERKKEREREREKRRERERERAEKKYEDCTKCFNSGKCVNIINVTNHSKEKKRKRGCEATTRSLQRKGEANDVGSARKRDGRGVGIQSREVCVERSEEKT